MANDYDVVTFGETMLRLSPPSHQRLEQAQSLDMEVGGSESNVAVGLSRLGVKVAWVSALPDNALGHYVERKIAIQGVDTSHIIWSDKGRLGLYWVEQGAVPRSSKVIYDRSHSAISEIHLEQFPDKLFQSETARLLHLSGITPALSDQAAGFTMKLLEKAKAAGWKISFDLNYRAKLWDTEQAREGCSPFIEQADIIFAPHRDVQQVFNIKAETTEGTLTQFRQSCPQAIVIMTVGASGALACLPDGDIVHENGFEAIPVDPIGAGDAFVAGFLSQFIQQDDFDLQTALRWANAAAALKYTIQGDMLLISRDDILTLIEETSRGHIQR